MCDVTEDIAQAVVDSARSEGLDLSAAAVQFVQRVTGQRVATD